MKVLFVCSGNNGGFEIMPFIKEQGDAMLKLGVEIDYFPIKGKGLKGYLKAGFHLWRYLKKNHYDVIHAHFTLSGWTAVIGSRNIPVVLSLLGTDAYGTYIGINKVRLTSRFFTLLTWLIQPFVDAIICKSKNIEKYVYAKSKSYIIPNGVDITKFKPSPKNGQHNGSNNKKSVLFLGRKTEVRKNYPLAYAAVAQLGLSDVELINPYPIAHNEIPLLLNKADVLVVPSLMEGSPNVVKEAMACNCPIVATDTGDVRWILGETEGCYVSSFNQHEFTEKLRLAIRFSETKGRTNGNIRIKELGLDHKSVAEKIIDVYKYVLMKKNKGYVGVK
jgi:glycosyltransferase involved in cell wall biosynthesis